MSTTIPLSINDIKNAILAGMGEAERLDAIVGETRDGGYIILTEHRVIEVYTSGGSIYAQSKNTTGTWETQELWTA